jgi:hypothetical protein
MVTALDRGKPVAGEIRIADRGYANAQAWQRFLQASEGQADYIVRMRWSTVGLVDEVGGLFDIIGWLKALPQARKTHETTVWAQSGKHQRLLRIRLIARRKTPEAIVGPIPLKMFPQASPKTHLRLANPRRRRKQAVNYPIQNLS